MRLSVRRIVSNDGRPFLTHEYFQLNSEFHNFPAIRNMIVSVTAQTGFRVKVNQELALGHS